MQKKPSINKRWEDLTHYSLHAQMLKKNERYSIMALWKKQHSMSRNTPGLEGKKYLNNLGI